MRVYVLLGADGKFYDSSTPGTVGGYRRKKKYGRLDCPSALSHIAKGHYVPYRVFFADDQTTIEAGYRPCGVCMKEAFEIWKQSQPLEQPDKAGSVKNQSTPLMAGYISLFEHIDSGRKYEVSL